MTKLKFHPDDFKHIEIDAHYSRVAAAEIANGILPEMLAPIEEAMEKICNHNALLTELLKPIEEKLRIAEEALGTVDRYNRLRGYPTPREWDQVVVTCRQALARIRGEK